MNAAVNVWDRIAIGSDEECWPWSGSLTTAGYGQISINKRLRPTHRVAFELVNGKVPDGLVLDHLCRNTVCCNPSHLEAVTQRVNILRGEGLGARYAARQTCDQGHPLELDRTRGRRCRICRSAADRAQRRAIAATEGREIRRWTRRA